MRNRAALVLAIATALMAAAAAVVLFVVAPAGAGTAQAAVIERVEERADRGSSKILAQRDWGEGQLVLVGYDRRGVRRLGIAFAAERTRGWHLGAYTEETVEPEDVVVGSLLIASSGGGDGQPAWSAAVGELIDDRIDRVEIRWASGDKTVGPRVEASDAYLVVERGTTRAVEARYLSREGTEIAKVPVESDAG